MQDAGPFVCGAIGFETELYQQADCAHRVVLNRVVLNRVVLNRVAVNRVGLNCSYRQHIQERLDKVRLKRRGMKTVERFVIAVLGVVCVFGCATKRDVAVDLPGGETGYSISCGSSRSWEKCFSRASELCGSGYEIVSRTTEDVKMNAPNLYGPAAGPNAERIMVIKCI